MTNAIELTLTKFFGGDGFPWLESDGESHADATRRKPNLSEYLRIDLDARSDDNCGEVKMKNKIQVVPQSANGKKAAKPNHRLLNFGGVEEYR